MGIDVELRLAFFVATAALGASGLFYSRVYGSWRDAKPDPRHREGARDVDEDTGCGVAGDGTIGGRAVGTGRVLSNPVGERHGSTQCRCGVELGVVGDAPNSRDHFLVGPDSSVCSDAQRVDLVAARGRATRSASQ